MANRIRKPRPQTEIAPAPVAWGRTVSSAVVATIATGFMLALNVPWNPIRAGTIGYFDFSWMVVLHDAVATGRQFGRELIIPYGPLGFIATNIYDPRTYLLLLAIRILLSLAVMYVLWKAARKFFPNPLWALPWLLAIIAMMGPGITAAQAAVNAFDPRALGGAEDHFFSICAVVTLLGYFGVDDRKLSPGTLAMVAVLAVASLAKVNFFMQDIVVVGVISLDQLLVRARRFWLAGAVYGGCLALFYLVARQSPGSIARFIWGWAEVTGGHMDAVALPAVGISIGFLPQLPIDLITFSIVATGVLGLIAWTQWRRQRWAGMRLAAAMAVLFALLYKHSFVRQDFAHATIAPMTAFAAALFYLPVAWRTSSKKIFQGACITIVTVAGIAVWSSLMNATETADGPGEGLGEYFRSAAVRGGDAFNAIAVDVASPRHLHGEWEEARTKTRKLNRLPMGVVVGPADVYPHRQDILFAYSLSYDPRPAFSSFFATAPALAELNARHLQGPSAPQTILFDIETVDQQYPALADGFSWPELLTRYEIVDATGTMLVMRRRANPLSYRLIPQTTIAGQFDQPVAIPDTPTALLWARIHLHRRGSGRFVSMIYKPPMLEMDVQTRDGAVGQYRLLPALGERGFLLSPVVKDRLAFAQLASSRWRTELSQAAVHAVTISVVDGSRDLNYDSGFTIELDRLEIAK